jgi:hypothetical protein
LRRIVIVPLAIVALLAAALSGFSVPAEAALPNVASGAVTHVRWVITDWRDPSSEDYVQVADLILIAGGVPLPDRSDDPTILVTNPGGSNPSGEGPDKGYDGESSTKWLDFESAINASSTLVIAFPAPVTFDSYSWVTADDAEGRDPISWRLEVSCDGETFTTVDSRSDVSVTPGRAEVVGPFDLAGSCDGGGTTGREFGSGRNALATAGGGQVRDAVSALEPRLRGRVK